MLIAPVGAAASGSYTQIHAQQGIAVLYELGDEKIPLI
jgi:hypothetical protein